MNESLLIIEMLAQSRTLKIVLKRSNEKICPLKCLQHFEDVIRF